MPYTLPLLLPLPLPLPLRLRCHCRASQLAAQLNATDHRYQNLHSDMGSGEDTKLELDAGDTGTLLPGGFWEAAPGSGSGRRVPLTAPELPDKRYVHGVGAPHSTFHDPSGRLDIRDLPPTFIAVNFPLELGDDPTVGHTHINGPTRQIPGTQNSKLPLPSVDEEPDWMRYSTVSPAPAGCALIRDIRAWHGNHSSSVRPVFCRSLLCGDAEGRDTFAARRGHTEPEQQRPLHPAVAVRSKMVPDALHKNTPARALRHAISARQAGLQRNRGVSGRASAGRDVLSLPKGAGRRHRKGSAPRAGRAGAGRPTKHPQVVNTHVATRLKVLRSTN